MIRLITNFLIIYTIYYFIYNFISFVFNTISVFFRLEGFSDLNCLYNLKVVDLYSFSPTWIFIELLINTVFFCFLVHTFYGIYNILSDYFLKNDKSGRLYWVFVFVFFFFVGYFFTLFYPFFSLDLIHVLFR